MEILDYLILSPYFFLSGLSIYSGHISRTNMLSRPMIFNSLEIRSALSLHWFLLVITSLVIFLKFGFVFTLVLYGLTLLVSPFTSKIGAALFLHAGAIPADNISERDGSKIAVFASLLWIPFVFTAWLVGLALYF